MLSIYKWTAGIIHRFTLGAAPLIIIAVLTIVFHFFQEHYLFHIVVELLTASIGFGMWIIGLNTYKISQNHYFAFLGIAFGFVGGIDFFHALYSLGFGMGLQGVDQLLWYASRLVEGISLAASVLFLKRRVQPAVIILGFCMICIIIIGIIYQNLAGIIPESGNIIGLIIALFCFAAGLLIIYRRELNARVYKFMLLAVLTAVGCEFLLIDAHIESDRFLFAHLLNYLSFYFIYKALVETALESPFRTLFLSLSSANDELKNELSARAEAENALKVSEQRYRMVVNSLPDFLFRILADGTILEVMPTNQVVSRLSPEDKQKNILDVLPQELAKRFIKKAEQTLKANREVIFEYRTTIEGNKYDREARLVPVGNGEILVMVRDMTERNRNIAEIRMLYHAVRQSASTIVITDTKGNILYVNPQFTDITGYTAEEAIGKNIRILKSGYHQPDYYKHLWDAIMSGKEWRGEFQNKRKNGEIYWEQATISPFRNQEGVITRFIAVKEDVTERREAEQRLRESENRYRSLLEQSSDGIFVFDPLSGQLQEANDHFLKMLGYAETDATKLSVTDILSPENSHSLAECLAALTAGQKVTGLRRFLTKSGKTIYVEIGASMVQIGAKRVVLVSVRDVTESRRQQEILKKDFMLAATVQHGFLRTSVTDGKVEIQTIFEPADLVSGDLYGYKWVKNGNVLFGFLFDIMGHGLATALKTSALMLLFLQASEKNISLKDKMAWVNRESMNLFTDDSFAAAFCFELDLDRKTLSYVSGGITHFLASANQISGQVECEGDLLGINPSAVYDEKTISVNKGDNYFFITDGLLELLSPGKIDVADFSATMEELRLLAGTANRRDDCSGLCFTVK